MLEASETADITIVGAGPVGLFGAFYAGMRQMSVRVIDSLPQPGGQLMALYPEKYIYDMPGFKKVLAKELAENLLEQATQFGAELHMDHKALDLKRTESGELELITHAGVFRSRTLILAAGAGAFAPIRLTAPGIVELEGKGVSYHVSNVNRLIGKRVLVIGGGDSAVDWCRTLSESGSDVSLIHRRDVFKAHEESVDWLLNRSGVPVNLWTEVESATRGDSGIQVSLLENRTRTSTTLNVDEIVCALGFKADIGPIKGWGITLEGSKVPVDRYMRTNIEGIYAAGDIATYEGKLDLIATGVSEICTAVYHARTILDPAARFKQVHSSNMF